MSAQRTTRMIKNAGFLYFRMLLTLAVTLYTSRIVLQVLGVEDFGIFHVVGGFILVLGFLLGAMSSATQRFLAFELGKPQANGLNRVFVTSLYVHGILAFIVLLFGETLGIYFTFEYLNIPEGRESAVRWVFHFAILSFVVTTISVPYNAMIIANERMKVYAWVSIIDALLKLGIVFLLQVGGVDKLILYGALTFGVSLIIFIVYAMYCRKTFVAARYKPLWDKKLFVEMVSFSGWNIWGNTSVVLANHGVNILLNIFFGAPINAAKTIAQQVNNALQGFVQNAQAAINPQIIKSYSAKDWDYTNKLINYGSKYNFFIIYTLALPILLHTDQILNFWLIDPPAYSASFVQLILLNTMLDSMARPLVTAAQATGKIKLYQAVVGGVLLLNLPLAFVTLEFGGTPASVFLVAIAVTLLAFCVRIIMLKRIYPFSVRRYFCEVTLRIGLVVASATAMAYTIVQWIAPVSFWISLMFSGVIAIVAIYSLGLGGIERNMIRTKLTAKFKQKKEQL